MSFIGYSQKENLTESYRELNSISYDEISLGSIYARDFSNKNFTFDNLNVDLPKSYKPVEINFSLQSEGEIITRLRRLKKQSSQKKNGIALIYKITTLDPKEEYKGSIFIHPGRHYIVHFVPTFFSQTTRREILRLVLLFLSKKHLDSNFFRLYTENCNIIKNIELTENTDNNVTSAHIKNTIGMINHSIRNVVGGNFVSEGIKTFYTDRQKEYIIRRPTNKVLLNTRYNVYDDEDIVYELDRWEPGISFYRNKDNGLLGFMSNVLPGLKEYGGVLPFGNTYNLNIPTPKPPGPPLPPKPPGPPLPPPPPVIPVPTRPNPDTPFLG